jgi:hypothetical protein
MAPSRTKRRKKKDARPQGPVVKHEKREVQVRTELTQVVDLNALFGVATLF